MATTAPPTVPLTRFTVDGLGAILEGTTDLILMVDGDFTVLAITLGLPFADQSPSGWLGLNLSTLTGPESRPKLDLLRADADLADTPQHIWRHLNLRRRGEAELPLLLKMFRDRSNGVVRYLVVARDLRPLREAQQRFLREEAATERRYARIREAEARQTLAAHGYVAPAIINEAVRHLVQRCIATAMTEAEGSETRAAEILGISAETLSALKG